MVNDRNVFGQEVGKSLPGWTKRAMPAGETLTGRSCRLEKLAEKHAAELYSAYASAPDARDWTYLSIGPFKDEAEYRAHVERASAGPDPVHYAIIDAATNQPLGTVALMRIDPDSGVVEIGWVAYSTKLQRCTAGTETMYLLMHHVFDDLGYRRCEWKCDSMNAPSRRAAQRLGFHYEGTFRQAMVYKGRSRDTAYYSIIDVDWPVAKKAFEAWLVPGNFNPQGRQRQSLATLRGRRMPVG